MEEARQRGYEQAVLKLVQMGASRELAKYLVGLEVRIRKLEQG